MKNKMKFISFIITLIVVFTSIPLNVLAEDETDLFFTPEENIITNQVELLAPNGIPITVSAKSDGTGVNVHVGNVGVDGLDSVTVTVKATGYTTPKTQTSYVPAVIGKNFSFSFPMIKSKTIYDATIKIIDGSGTITRTAKSTLEFTESKLESAKWHKGTFSSRASSLDYHFNKHKSEVGSTNIVSYLNKATNYRTEIINDITNKNTDKYKITTGTGSIASKKYKNKSDLRFAILTNSGNQILSFGR